MLPSAATAVQPSSSTTTSDLPAFTIGSMAITMPERSFMPRPRSPKFGTCGSSCIWTPMPWPTKSRTTENPSASTTPCTAAPTSPRVAPGLTAAIPACNEASVTFNSRTVPGSIFSPTGTVMAASPK